MQEATELGQEDLARLLRDRRLALLVDLDQTLVHTTHDDIDPNLKVSTTFGPRCLATHILMPRYSYNILFFSYSVIFGLFLLLLPLCHA